METTMEGETPPQLQQRCSELRKLAQGCVKDGSDASSAELGLDCLMDTFLTLFDECQQDCFSRNKNVAAFVKKYKEVVKKTKALRIKPSDFEVKATIGRGHFGEVHVVHEKTTDTVYAMKVLRKTDLLSQPDISFFEEERDIMARCLSPWLTRLHFAFQDSHSLYLVMDFHPGGDLLSLLSRHGDQLDEDMARFYLAEMAVAINSLHHMGYLHRDVKPENILLDHSGHIKLADFGSAAKMDSNNKVSSRMPVGTPDYVAPELLDSMNRASISQRYGVEVDWWSLGVCAYEMLFGCTPFTDENGSMVATYNNIMNFQKKLKFPAGSEVSQEARDLIRGLLSDKQNRLGFSQLTQHPFFSTVSWDTIRSSPPPYVPSISSLDDTSNFDEVEKAKPPPNLDSFQPHAKDFSGRHLPFVGFTFARCAAHQPPQRSPKKSVSGSSNVVASMLSDELDSSVGLNTACYNLSNAESSTSLQPSHMHTQVDNSGPGEVVRELRARCSQLEGRVDYLEAQKAALEKELQEYMSRNKALTQQLEQEKLQCEGTGRQSVDTWQDLQAVNAQITSLEDQMLSFQLDELRDIIVQLETEQESLTQRLLHKDRHIESLDKALATAQQQLAAKQLKLDRERRKSREGQRQHLALFESHEDTWSKQLEEKQATINELTRKVRDLEDLVRAYEEQEEEQAGELQQLHYKLNTSLTPQGLDSTHLDLDSSATARMHVTPASPKHSKKVSLQVTLKPGQRSLRDNKTAERLKELQGLVDRYSKEASSWKTREDTLQKKVAKLEGDLKSQVQKEGVSQQTKESLMSKVHVYQQEVRMQRKLIQELQKKMRSYLDDQTTLTHTEAKLKELQCQNLDLEGELFNVKQEAEQTRQACMDKTREMEDIIAKLETARRQVQEYQNKYSKEVENTDIRTRQLERQVGSMEEERRGLTEQVKSLLDQVESLQGLVDEGAAQVSSLTERNTQLQRQLHDYTQRNATLLRQVESMQKEHKEDAETDATTKAELHTQVNRLQQANDDLSQQLQASQRQRRDLDDKVMTLQRDAERLRRKVGRLEGVESEKRQLETRLESLAQLEREKKRLELKLSRLEDVEQERAQQQLKVERLEVSLRSQELELQTARQEKKEAEEKVSSLLTQQQEQQETLQAPHSPQASESGQQMQQSPASRKLMLDLLRSEKEELERQVTELQHINVSAKEMREDLEAKEEEVKSLKRSIKALESKAEQEEREMAELKAKVRSLEGEIKAHRDSDKREQTAAWRLREDAEKKDAEISTLQKKVRALEKEAREAEKRAEETARDLRAKVTALQDKVKDNERKVQESSSNSSSGSSNRSNSGSELRAKVRAFEGQGNKSCSGSEGQEREKTSLSALAAEVRDLRAQLRMKTSAMDRLQAEKDDLQKQVKEKETEKEGAGKKGVLERAPSVEGRHSKLVERLQSEKAELQRQLERMEKERDSLRLATPGRLRGSGVSERDSISVLRGEGGSRIRAELEDKVQRLERVVRELEQKLEISSASSVDKHTLRSEIEQLKQQIKETAQAQAQVVPQEQYDSLQDSHHKVQEQVATLQTKVEQLTDDKSRLEKASQSQRRDLEARIKNLETENGQLKDSDDAKRRAKGLEQEKAELSARVKSLEQEKAELTSRAKQEKAELTGRVEDLHQQLKTLEGQLAEEKTRVRREEVQKLKAELTSSSSSSSSSSSGHRLVGDLTQEKLALESKVKSLERQLESLQSRRQEERNQAVQQMEEEKAQLTSQVQELTSQLSTLRQDKAQGQSTSRATTAENTKLKQQNEELQTQVEGLLVQTSELKKEVASSIQTQTEAEAKIESLELQVKDLMSDSSRLRQEVSRLEAAAKEERVGKEKAGAAAAAVGDGDGDVDDSPEGEELRQANAYLRTKVEELERHLERANTRPSSGANMSRDVVVAELRQELHESNLAVSEARSLLSAAKRQETELRERVERLQRALDNGAVLRASNIQMAHGADQELRVLRSQYDTLQRQYKNLEERQNGSHRDRAATVMEITLLKDQLQTKQQQLEAEIKKTKRMGALSLELDEQIKDFEAIVADYEKKEAQWTHMGQQFEKKLSEKEQELADANHKLQALSSSRLTVDCRVDQLNQELQSLHSRHRQEVARLNSQVKEERDRAQIMAAKITSFDEKERGYKEVLEVQSQNIRAENEVINQLKEDLSAKLTEVHDLKTTNVKLRKHLDQAMDKFELIFGEKVSLENFTEALQGLHFLEKYKFESTIGQQMKLIDYLQELYMENAGKKKKGSAKRFGSQKGKDGGVGVAGVPLQWTDLTTALEQEQKKTGKLQEQLDRLREENFAQANELLKLKGPLKEKFDNRPPSTTHSSGGALTPHRQQAALNTLMRSPSAQTPQHPDSNTTNTKTMTTPSLRSTPGRRRSQFYYVGSRAPGPQQRMHHNIPHRFVTGLNTRATKCGLCLGSVHFVKQASKCQECGMVVHPKCTSSVPATCGLPTEYVRHFADMMFRIEEAELDSTLDPVSIKMEGWLKVPRTGKPGWEKRWVVLDGSCLLLYREDTDANPVDTFDLCPPDAEVSVHSAVTAAELTGTASLDLYYVLRLDQDPLTTCWPGRYLYLMTTNFSDKQRWVAALEAAVRSMQRRDTLVKNIPISSEPHMLTMLSLKDSDRKEFNCALPLSPQLVLLGTDDGLFALNPQSTTGRQHLVQLSGFGSVHQMAEAKGVNVILLLTGPERRLVMVESKLIQCRMSQTVGGESTPFSYKAVEGVQRCTVFEVALWNNASYLLCGTPDRLILLKFNPSLAMYCIRKEMPSNQPCSCICVAESFAIVGTERFYRISLEHPSLIDFVDRQDSSLAFAAFGAANHHSFPLAVVQVSPEGLPVEFLLCFHEFGVFVDHRGQRSRQSDIKWSGLPLSFSYKEPFLYITYLNSVQATVVPTDKDQVKGCQTAVDLPAPRYLGKAEEGGAIYIACSGNGITEVILLRARDVRGELPDSDNDDDKENFTSRQVRFAPSPDKGYGGSFQVKTSVSLLSLDSLSSGSTFTSVESTL